MRPLLAPVLAVLALACAPAALALPGKAQYSGKTSDAGSVRVRLSGDGKLVAKLRIYYTVSCDDGSGGTTYTDVLNLRIKKGKFTGHGSYTGSSDKSRNDFKISGAVTKTKATGSFSLTATGTNKDSGAAIDCKTGTLSFSAKRVS